MSKLTIRELKEFIKDIPDHFIVDWSPGGITFNHDDIIQSFINLYDAAYYDCTVDYDKRKPKFCNK